MTAASRLHLINACCLAVEVEIKRTHDDAGVAGVGFVQPHEVFPIQRHDGTLVGGSYFKDRLVRDRLPGLAEFQVTTLWPR